MRKTTVLGFYGYSQSGKTTLLERLIRDLTASGLHVAVIKQTDKKESVDLPGNDTVRLIHAGAELAVFSSDVETIYIANKNSTTQEMVERLTQFGNFDVIFVEGARDVVITKIRLGDCTERENTLFTYDGNYEQLLEKIKRKIL